MAQSREVHAAGAVVSRPGREVLVVHRPKYDDWSFPKGKLDRGEHPVLAAVREVGEETGLQVRLGPALPPQRYEVALGTKTVHYWTARVVGDDDVSRYLVNDEIDGVAWVPRDEAARGLTYERDRRTLLDSEPLRKNSHALVVLRHAAARSRKVWRGDDRLRPLLVPGVRQSEALAPLLAAYGVNRVVTSSSTRCVQTVSPYVARSGWPLEAYDDLSEEYASTASVLEHVDDLLHAEDGSVLCSHRPVLPGVFDALGVPDADLGPAAMLVVHHRRGRVVATEAHPAP